MTVPTPYDTVKDLPFADHKFENTPQFTTPIQFALTKDPSHKVTLFPIHDHHQLPPNLIQVIENEFNFIVDEGLTYPHHNPLHGEEFTKYWFLHFVAVLLDGDTFSSVDELKQGDYSVDQWEKVFLGNFYIKPNYIGRCSHVCNAGFVVNHNKRGLGLGKELGKKYLEIAPKLGYVYSVFNLVFETNAASLKIWDSLGFERIGYVKHVAVLKGHDKLVGAYMFGKDLQ
ncbi:uncharacterized protein SPAPADRAFT_59421 [Spathaspora passalidarum NRRL Y-27907]|uniref:N-acetyltransferase domain-containing protein n=1 Tax=Spathaspora passalidarum (strain NRRL Y-27907 / 11-Y1) TaxID=619300 RepID=G3AJV6_SPAPN|nr:uncharacterized protein SPAPADRAFT_59421 [Spathaspora passalidarum NRRL Y-27907]EGW34008.1 hypothetical protein SPAPADRAFT_59421 [Spathaspora passalidarum NRRL Y-27907]